MPKLQLFLQILIPKLHEHEKFSVKGDKNYKMFFLLALRHILSLFLQKMFQGSAIKHFFEREGIHLAYYFLILHTIMEKI